MGSLDPELLLFWKSGINTILEIWDGSMRWFGNGSVHCILVNEQKSNHFCVDQFFLKSDSMSDSFVFHMNSFLI